MIFRYFISLILGAGLSACSYHLHISGSQQNIDNSCASSIEMDSMVSPYRRLLQQEFGVVIGETEFDLLTTRTSMTLGFWVCDQLIQETKKQENFQSEPVLAIFNYGGFRADIPAGKISIGDIYKVMPFDNRLVYLKISRDRLQEVVDYMKVKGGEPIGGFRIEKGIYQLKGAQFEGKDYVWVVTSDFLANGGDQMQFFSNPLERIDSTTLLRDFIIEAVKKEQKITFSDKERISW